MKRILVTGAAGGAATMIRPLLRAEYRLRLSDIVPVADLAEGEEFIAADVSDFDAMLALVDGCDGIVHFGGYAVEGPWEVILKSNIAGGYNLFEAARQKGVKRVVFPSSNHVVGFYRRDQRIDTDVTLRPDSRYGISKCFGEALASLYADKYGLEVLTVRIGNVQERPLNVRLLSIWISPRDLVQLLRIGFEHPGLRYEVVYGISDNARGWWDNTNAFRLGYRPRDRSEDYAAEILAAHPERTGDDLVDDHQGGGFVRAEADGDPLKAPVG
jgi:uronate dehydrogenase